MRKVFVCLVGLLLWVNTAQGQGVAAVHDQLLWVQGLASASNELEMIRLAMKNLAPLPELQHALSLVASAQQLVGQLQTLGSRMLGRQHWWSEQALPSSVGQLAHFRHQSQDVCRQSHADALGAQTLITDLAQVLHVTMHFLSQLQSLMGSVSNLQGLQVQLAAVTQTMSALSGLSATAHESAVCERLRDSRTQQAYPAIISDEMRTGNSVERLWHSPGR